MGEGLTKTACGSPHNVAHEMRQAGGYEGKKVDAWSCGVIVYLMVTGRLPFDDENPRSFEDQVRYRAVVYPDDISNDAHNLT